MMTAAEDAATIAASRVDAASQLMNEKSKTNANTARRSVHTRGNMTKKNAFTTKKYKGWCPSKICKDMDIKFKRRQEYSSDMGGFASSASEGSSSGSESESGVTSDE